MRTKLAVPAEHRHQHARSAPLRVALALSLDASDLELLRRLLSAWRKRDQRAAVLLQRIARSAT